MTAPWTVTKRKLDGSPYIAYTLRVGGQVILSRLEPISEDEARALVRAHMNPEPVPAFVSYPRGKPGPKPGAGKSASVNARGFLWKDEE